MSEATFSSSGLPEFHHATLVVKARPALAQALGMAAAAGSTVASSVAMAPGVDFFLRLAGNGFVRRVTPLGSSRTAAAFAPQAMALGGGPGASFAAVAMSVNPGIRSSGTALVELEDEAVTDEVLSRLRDDASVEYAARVPARYLLARKIAPKRPSRRVRTGSPASAQPTPALPAAIPPPGLLWNLRQIRWDVVSAAGRLPDASAIRVAVLDTGVDAGHPDLAGVVGSYVYQHPAVASASGPEDIVGHGTHVAGTIAASGKGGSPVKGICCPDVRVWKIFNDKVVPYLLYGAFLYVVDPVMYRRALADCAEEGIDVVNLSIGGPQPPDSSERELFEALLESGATVVAAMGNERKSGSPTSFPAAIPGIVAVGATKLDDSVASFSNRGPHISLCAPGTAIWSTLPTYPGRKGYEARQDASGRWVEGKPLTRDTDYDAWDGTSMATPHVAAASALLLAKSGKLGPQGVRQRLMATADPVPAMQGAAFHQDFGAGRLNLDRLL